MTGVVLAPVALLAYGLHARGQYRDLDAALARTAQHLAREIAGGSGHSLAALGEGDVDIFARAYDRQGEPLSREPAPARPGLTPTDVLSGGAAPAYEGLVRLLPGRTPDLGGGFAISRDPFTGDRLRVHVVAVAGGDAGYIMTWRSLRQLDDASAYLALVLAGVVVGGVLAAGAGSYAVARQVLRPVSVMTLSAHGIAASRGFSRRVEEPGRLDELGRLARTFNEMLGSLEEAYRSQQRFVADAAHELRAPLTAIQGNIDLLKHVEDMPPAERAEALAYVEAESARLARIVSELLMLARADAGQSLDLRPVELDRVLIDALAEVRPLASTHAFELAEIEPAAVMGDADRLKQLILNLVDNSIKYTAPGGRIAVSLLAEDGMATLRVADEGIGIPAEDLPRVFERFYRADPARARDPGGTGLGLSIVAWIVSQHAGQVTVASHQGEGTSVTIRLPLSALSAGGHAAPGTAGARLDPRARRGGARPR